MSKFLTDRYQSLDPYTPGEQPKEREYIKLNTNESPFPPSPTAIKLASEELRKLMLYSDPECKSIVSKMAEVYGIKSEKIIMTNGSDEVLNFEVSGDKIEAVHMLPGYTHNIINLSKTENLVTLMWASEQFDPNHPDTFAEKV